MATRTRRQARPKAKVTVSALPSIELEEPPVKEPSLGEQEETVETVETILSKVQMMNVRLLTDEQIRQLVNLKMMNGSPMLTLENRYFIYELIAMIYKNSYQTIYSYLQSQPWTTHRDILLQSPSLKALKEKTLMDAESYRRKQGVSKGIHKCGRCGSEETWSSEKQMRSADEPATITVECVHCGNRWKL